MMNQDNQDNPRDLVHFPQTHRLGVSLQFKYSTWSSKSQAKGDREWFWRTFREVCSWSDSDWRHEASPELLEAELERKLSSSLGRSFSRRFLGRDGKDRRFPGDPGESEAVPGSLYMLVKRVSFCCRVTGYSSLNLEVAVSGFQSLAEIFERDFESFKVFFEPFLFQALETAYDGRLASSLSADPDFSEGFRADFERRLPSSPSSSKQPTKQRPWSDSQARAEWLLRLVNGSLVVPVVLALLVLIFAGIALRDLHRSYVDGLARLLEVAITQRETAGSSSPHQQKPGSVSTTPPPPASPDSASQANEPPGSTP